jgi:hypothetical protein
MKRTPGEIARRSRRLPQTSTMIQMGFISVALFLRFFTAKL